MVNKIVRSARGEMVDFGLLAIKAQLAQQSAPADVEKRSAAISAKSTGKTVVAESEDATDMLQVSAEAAQASQRGKQLSRK
jgi:hypothetical protein